MKNELLPRLQWYRCVSDHVASCLLRQPCRNGSNTDILVISCYAPTNAISIRDESIREEFYDTVEAELARVANRTITLVGGDWNAKPGNDHENNHCLGQHAKYRSISSNGTYLLDFCNRLGLLLANTLFPHPQRHKTTWVAPPRPGYRHPTRNQIDFCIVKGVHQCVLLDSRSYSGTATSSDHFMVITRMMLRIPNSSSKYRNTRAELCNRCYDVANLVSKEEVQVVSRLRDAHPHCGTPGRR